MTRTSRDSRGKISSMANERLMNDVPAATATSTSSGERRIDSDGVSGQRYCAPIPKLVSVKSRLEATRMASQRIFVRPLTHEKAC